MKQNDTDESGGAVWKSSRSRGGLREGFWVRSGEMNVGIYLMMSGKVRPRQKPMCPSELRVRLKQSKALR